MAQHKIVINSANRISGTAYNFCVPIKVSNIRDVEKLNYVKLENTSIISANAPANLYIGSSSFSFPYTYSTNQDNETSVIGYIPLKANDASPLYYHFADAQDNQGIFCTNIEGVIKSNLINIQIVKRDGTFATTFSSDYTLTLVFSEN